MGLGDSRPTHAATGAAGVTKIVSALTMGSGKSLEPSVGTIPLLQSNAPKELDRPWTGIDRRAGVGGVLPHAADNGPASFAASPLSCMLSGEQNLSNIHG